MEAASSSSSSSSSLLSALLRHRLRATVRSCFGNGGALGQRLRWRGRAGAEEFRYDPLSYALNFDDGEEDRAARHGGRVLCRSFSSQLTPAPRAAVEAA